MKKVLVLAVLLCAAILCLASCGGKTEKPEDTSGTPKEPATLESIYSAVSQTIPDADKLTDVPESYLSGFLKASKDDFASYKIVTQSISTSIDEIGIFEAKSAEDVEKIEKMIDTFFEFRLAVWDPQYLKEEYPKLEKASRVTGGNFVMYMILSDDARADAEKAFRAAAN